MDQILISCENMIINIYDYVILDFFVIFCLSMLEMSAPSGHGNSQTSFDSEPFFAVCNQMWRSTGAGISPRDTLQKKSDFASICVFFFSSRKYSLDSFLFDK